ncbi:hypothetical protein NDU88_006775 [Pleurodeles waltl]|uniref:Uncharacterized protein n=1 Tax=Pleurodeles waltl TaxID=8319 RepID=A0AAV7SQR8_PLEWA|nr:hypothetical protein NDU88_006775 [Pleurodeles waltl]
MFFACKPPPRSGTFKTFVTPTASSSQSCHKCQAFASGDPDTRRAPLVDRKRHEQKLESSSLGRRGHVGAPRDPRREPQGVEGNRDRAVRDAALGSVLSTNETDLKEREMYKQRRGEILVA